MQKTFLAGSKLSMTSKSQATNPQASNIALSQSAVQGKAAANKDGSKTAEQKAAEKEMSSEEILAGVEIYPIENTRLNLVFEKMSNAAPNKIKHKEEEPYICADDIAKILGDLGFKMSKSEIDLMIWEVDENLDGRVTKDEFFLMFKRCIKDDTGLEPKNLFNLVQFLMYTKCAKNKITEEDTLELIYVRERDIKKLEAVLKTIFGEDIERRMDGQEKEITFAEFLDKRNKRALELRREKIKQMKEAKNTLKKKDE